MIFRPLICLGLMTLASCETVPSTLDPMVFASESEQIQANPSVVSADAALTSLLARTDLTPQQRADALFLRAEKRWTAKFDLPGAIEDFEAFLTLAPEDVRVSEVKRDEVFAATEIENAQRRLSGLQNITDWFDDKVLMGELDDGAMRYKNSGLTPTDLHLYLLREAGYVCAGEDDPVHVHGPMPEHAADASWCPASVDS
ncbi:MAG: hypothetical protein ACE37M_14810 [Henriciella sp.]